MLGEFLGSRVLILGGAGFIGRHLCRALLLAGADVRCYDLHAPIPDGVSDELEAKAEWLQGDFADTGKLKSAVDGVQYVIHLVSTTIPETSNKNLQHDLTSNVVSTINLLEILRSTKIKKLLFASSGGTVYGRPNTIPVSELHETNPICGYGIHKLAIEKYLYYYHYEYDLDYCILRLSNPYGVAQISDRPQGVIGRFVYKALRQEQLEIWGDGSVVRDYLYVDDMIDAFLLAMKTDSSEKVFNIASGTGHTLMDIIQVIKQTIGHTLHVQLSPPRHVDVPVNILDISRARTELNWNPKVDIQVGIQKMVAYGQQLLGRP